MDIAFIRDGISFREAERHIKSALNTGCADRHDPLVASQWSLKRAREKTPPDGKSTVTDSRDDDIVDWRRHTGPRTVDGGGTTEQTAIVRRNVIIDARQ